MYVCTYVICTLYVRTHVYVHVHTSTVKPDLPRDYEEQTWTKLREAILAVQRQKHISYSLEELYQAVENMCSYSMAAKLYDKLRTECEDHVKSLVPVFQQYPQLTIYPCRCHWGGGGGGVRH